ncbi:hypothetical protein C8R46DRAFT_875181, partial [Mycena filopes]
TRLDSVERAIKEQPNPSTPTTNNNAPTASYATGPLIHPTRKAQQPTAPRLAPKKVVTNPLDAHHPSRLIVQILPEGLAPEERPEPMQLCKEINARLAGDAKAKDMLVVSTKWNTHGNCIVFTREDQTAAELVKHAHLFTDIIGRGKQTVARVDSKWIKIQVNGVRTGAFDSIPGIYSPGTLDTEFRTMNPAYARLKIVMEPRWMRATEELGAQAYSSVVFAVEDDEQAHRLLREVKSMAAFGRNVFMRHYADRPPVIQCRKCWKFDHHTTACNDTQQTCRLCGEAHTEEEHRTNCTNCKAEAAAEG